RRKTSRTTSKKTNLKREVLEGGATSIKEVIADSRTGQHEIQDPSERLISIVGSSFFNEPAYHPADATPRTNEDGAVVGHYYDSSSLDEQAKLIIQTAMEIAETAEEVANSDSPRDLLAIAHWARKELKIRTTPQILLAVAAEMPATKKYVREYCKKIIQRADELKQVFAGYRHLFGSDSALPNSLKRGLADSFSKFGEYDFLKYEGKDRPHFADILKMIDRKKGWPLPKALDHYLKTGEITDEKEIPLIANRKALAKLKEFGPRAKELAKRSHATWENLLSQFGNSREVWEHLIDSGMPYMAAMRNLRNMVEAGVSAKHQAKIAKKIVDGAVDGKQLPFRYVSAEFALRGQTQKSYFGRSRKQPEVPENAKVYVDALRQALEKILEAMPDIPGRTIVATDNSASMDQAVSEKSMVTRNMAGTILGALFKRKSAPGSVIGGFGDFWKPLQGGNDLSVTELAERVGALDVGHSTNAENVIEWALGHSKKFDRIIIVSDMQTYGGGGGGWGYRRHSQYKPLKQLIEKYRAEKNKDCKLHCIDLGGTGRSLTEQQDTNTNLISGFSEKLLNMILEFEASEEKVEPVKEKKVKVETPERTFSIEYIRKNY
ncbi:MAG: TROVE domain-containing protein, partial [Candidatus Bathyarchaeota archaeon]|nr:TROVE domain-containing protein [Candidatus Bathyarchaeota archaeon]